MINEMVELVADWLAGSVPGYEAQALAPLVPAVQRNALDPNPPTIPAIADDVRDEWVALGNDPLDVPALVVAAGSDPVAVPLDTRAPADVRSFVIGAVYVHRNNLGAVGRREAGYCIAAAMQSLDYLGAAPQDVRRRRGVELVRVTHLTERRLTGGLGSASFINAVVGIFHLRRIG